MRNSFPYRRMIIWANSCNHLKNYIGFIIFFNLGLILQINAQNVGNYSVCSGQSQTLEVTRYYDGTIFDWYVGSNHIINNSNKLVVNQKTDVPLEQKYRCILKLNMTPYDTVFFTVNFNPFTAVEILANNLCDQQMATFYISDLTNIKEQMWTINDNFVSYHQSTDYLCNTSKIKVKLSIVNKFGCKSEVEKTFNVTAMPRGEVYKNVLINKNYFVDNVDCGNSFAEYQVYGLDTNSKVNRWYFLVNDVSVLEVAIGNGNTIISNDKKFIEFVESKDNTIKVKWAKTQISYNVTTKATYSNGNCNYTAILNTILVNDNSPDEGKVFQKPNESDVLIFPAGQNIVGLNYQWGYSDQNGKEVVISGNNRFYCEFVAPNGLNSLNKYWVETWYGSNDICRTRNYLDKVVSTSVSKSIGFSFFPNPVTDKLNVVMDKSISGRLIVSDLKGICLFSIPVYTDLTQTTIDVKELKPGNYVVSFISDSGNQVAAGSFIIK